MGIFDDLITQIEERRAAMNAQFDAAIAALRDGAKVAGGAQQRTLPGIPERGERASPPRRGRPAKHGVENPSPGSKLASAYAVLQKAGEPVHIGVVAEAIGTKRANIAGALDKAVSAGVLAKPKAATYQWLGGVTGA